MARPTEDNPTGAQKKPKKTPEVINLLEQAFALDATISEACSNADIAESTYYEWVKDDVELSERFRMLRYKPVLKARKSVVEAMEKDPKLALKYLGLKRNKEFTNKVIQDVVVSEKQKVEIDESMSLEEMSRKYEDRRNQIADE